jgi:hypothetical protein
VRREGHFCNRRVENSFKKKQCPTGKALFPNDFKTGAVSHGAEIETEFPLVFQQVKEKARESGRGPGAGYLAG